VEYDHQVYTPVLITGDKAGFLTLGLSIGYPKSTIPISDHGSRRIFCSFD
jgi:hypothetical protein